MSETRVGDDGQPSEAQGAVKGTFSMAKVPKTRNSEAHGIHGIVPPGLPCLVPRPPGLFPTRACRTTLLQATRRFTFMILFCDTNDDHHFDLGHQLTLVACIRHF